MTPERWAEIDAIVADALELDRAQHETFVASRCGTESELLAEVLSLLNSDAEAGADFLAKPPLGRLDPLPPAFLAIGTVLAERFRVEEWLGRGGMGQVYRAFDLRLEREVALKVLLPDRADNIARKVLREARAAAAISHRHVVTVYEVLEAQSLSLIVMEYVHGRTLEQLIRPEGLPLTEVVRYGVQVAEALSVAHAAGLVHRDLKPGNIMIADSGEVKVLDFGLAMPGDHGQRPATPKKLDEGTELTPETLQGNIAGTPAYMSPEQVEGCTVDLRGDLFSLGCVLYELLTGRRAFRGDSHLATLTAVLKDTPLPARKLRPQVSPELESILNRCFRKNPAERWQNALELRSALAALPLVASIESRPATRWKWLSLVVTSAALVFALVIPGVWTVMQSEAPSLHVRPLTSYPGSETFPSMSPDGRSVAFLWEGEDRGPLDIYVQDVEGGPARQLTRTPDSEISPAWSPDGRYIAYLRPEQGHAKAVLILTTPRGGTERRLTTLQLNTAGSMWSARLLNWSPDSRWLVVCAVGNQGGRPSLHAISAESGARHRLTWPPVSYEGDCDGSVNHDGKAVVFTRTRSLNVSELFLLQLDKGFHPVGEPLALTSNGRIKGGAVWVPDTEEIVFEQFQGARSQLFRMRARAQEKAVALALPGNITRSPAFGLRGGRMIYVSTAYDYNLWSLTLGTWTGPKGLPVPVAHSTFGETSPHPSPDGQRIVFASDRGGEMDLWLAGAKGENAVPLTRTGLSGAPRWSPDGWEIAFDSRAAGNSDIYVVSLRSGATRKLTQGASANFTPSWSNDGKWLYFSSNRTGQEQVWKVPVTGGSAEQVTKHGGTRPLVSPDGQHLYYAKVRGVGDVWRVPANGGAEERVFGQCYFFAFAVTAQGIYFVYVPPEDPGYQSSYSLFLTPYLRHPVQVRRYDFATGRVETVAQTGRKLVRTLAASWDGSHLLYSQLDENKNDLMLVENFQ